MSVKSSLVKMAIKCTPNAMVLWVANMILKDIAEMSDFSLDLDARKSYVQLTLVGESDPIEVWLEGFAITEGEAGRQFILEQAQSNKPWLNAIMSRIVGKAWKIPEIPQLAPYMGLLTELLAAKPQDEVTDQQVPPEKAVVTDEETVIPSETSKVSPEA